MQGSAELAPFPAAREREHEAVLHPIAAGLQPLLELPRAIGAQRVNADLGQRERAPALVRFERLEDVNRTGFVGGPIR